MKKILLSVLGLAGLCSSAQIFSEDFSSGLPSTFTLIDNDGLTPAANVSFVNDAWVARTGTDGNGYVASTSWYSPAGTSDDWLITPAITVTNADTYLLWKAGAPDQSFPDGYEVRVSIAGTAISDFLNVEYTTTGEDEPFVDRYIDLSLFAGNTIYIAFRNNSNDQFLLFVDDIVVDEFTSLDMAGSSVDMQTLLKTGSSTTIMASFQNLGKEITSADINYSINGGSVTTNTVNGLTVGPMGTVSLSAASWTPSAPGNYDIEVWLSNLNGSTDANTANDKATATVTVSDFIPHRNVIIEEKTGTWCQWCPRGAVGMEHMADNFPSSAIPIAVHNGDPMVDTEYDGNIGTVAPGGYPGSSVDRALGPDPNANALEAAYVERRTIPAIAAVDFNSITYNAGTGAVNAQASALFYAGSDADLRFAVAIVEDNVTGTTNGYAQVNAYAGGGNGAMGGYENLPSPVPASQMVYEHVARGIEPNFFGASGSVPGSVSPGDNITYDFSFNLPAAVNNDSEVHLVAMLLNNDTYEVINAKSYSLTAPNIGLIDTKLNGLSVYPNPANDVLGVYVDGAQEDVTVELVNAVGQRIYSETFTADEAIRINTSDFEMGMYILTVKSDSKVATQRVTISH
jgi:hypothetical protein